MDLKDLHDLFKTNTGLEWAEVIKDETKEGIAIKDKRFEYPIFIEWDNLKNVSKEEILIVLTGGKDVEQITRVTGFFSKVSSWNKGKLAELADRKRNLNWGEKDEV